jgi:hypothetical protein
MKKQTARVLQPRTRRSNKKMGSKQKKKTVTLYVSSPEIWTEARKCAASFDDSLSYYVELAVNALNRGLLSEFQTIRLTGKPLHDKLESCDGIRTIGNVTYID